MHSPDDGRTLHRLGAPCCRMRQLAARWPAAVARGGGKSRARPRKKGRLPSSAQAHTAACVETV